MLSQGDRARPQPAGQQQRLSSGQPRQLGSDWRLSPQQQDLLEFTFLCDPHARPTPTLAALFFAMNLMFPAAAITSLARSADGREMTEEDWKNK